MDFSKMRDAIKAMSGDQLTKAKNAHVEIGRLRELCRGKGEVEVGKHTLRVTILKDTENTRALIKAVDNFGIKNYIVENKFYGKN